MVEVTVHEGEDIGRALRVFKRKVQKAGVLTDLRRKRHYVKPSEAKAIKSAAARRRRTRKRGG